MSAPHPTRRAALGGGLGALAFGGPALAQDDNERPGSDEAREFCRKICAAVGLKQNFEIRIGVVPVAQAVRVNAFRRVIYNDDVMRKFDLRDQSQWPALAIFAHEVGHHLQGHTLVEGISTAAFELEATQFAGFVVARLGGTVEAVLPAFEVYGDTATGESPSRDDRLRAFKAGFLEAESVGCAEHILVITNNQVDGVCKRVLCEFIRTDGRWTEWQNGVEFTHYVEVQRLGNAIHLWDEGRKIWIRLTRDAVPGAVGKGEWGPVPPVTGDPEVVPTDWSPLDLGDWCPVRVTGQPQRVIV